MEEALLALANNVARHAKLEDTKKTSIIELNAKFVYQLYKAICVPVMDFDPVLAQFSAPEVLLGAIIECISKTFVKFDVNKVTSPQDLLAHKPQAWYSLLKVFQCLSDCLMPSPTSITEGSPTPETSSDRTEARKATSSGGFCQPASALRKPQRRSVLYSPLTAHARQKRLGIAKMRKKRDDHIKRPSIDVPAELIASFDEDSALKRCVAHAALKRAAIHYRNTHWHYRYMMCMKAKRLSQLDMLQKKKKQLQEEIIEKVSVRILAALSNPFGSTQ
uniref:Uncharacterized protein n=1 Tax=Trichuris muris TaxID=70415 RepID=A0A5S6QMY7_TRIMR